MTEYNRAEHFNLTEEFTAKRDGFLQTVIDYCEARMKADKGLQFSDVKDDLVVRFGSDAQNIHSEYCNDDRASDVLSAGVQKMLLHAGEFFAARNAMNMTQRPSLGGGAYFAVDALHLDRVA